jgi:putative DNA primase/helicase
MGTTTPNSTPGQTHRNNFLEEASTMAAERIAKALGGRSAGIGWMARCPAHDDREPSLSIRQSENGQLLVRCHAGCEQAQVIAALRSRGLWQGGHPRRFALQATTRTTVATERSEAAIAIWNAGRPAEGTLVQTYLSTRGIHIPLPAALRFHARLNHPSGSIWPAMVALVTLGADGVPLAVHRTFLASHGLGKAPVEPAKMMLGPCRGCAVRLGPIGDQVMIAEGIETALSAMQATGQTALAALSTSGLRSLELPVRVRNVVVLADGDDAGEAAAQDAGQRWKREGRSVRIARPPRGLDFNDVLLGRANGRTEGLA